MPISSLNNTVEGSTNGGTLLTPQDVARRLQVSVAWVRDHATRKHPRLVGIKIGGLLRFCSDDVDNFIKQQREIAARRAI